MEHFVEYTDILFSSLIWFMEYICQYTSQNVLLSVACHLIFIVNLVCDLLLMIARIKKILTNYL